MKQIGAIMGLLSLFIAGAAVAAIPSPEPSTALVTGPAAPTASAANEAPAKVKYTKGADINFEKLLIQGSLERPNLTIVTGNVQKGSDGLLRLRKDFLDRITTDFGEEIQ